MAHHTFTAVQEQRFRSIIRENFGFIVGWKLLVILTLFPIVFFPNSVDLNIFCRAADCINDGGRMYRDFIDIKPPLLYDIVALLRLTVGKSDVMLHLTDLVVHLIILFLVSVRLMRHTGDRILAFGATWLYALLYTCGGLTTSLQAEALALPCIALNVIILSRDQDSMRRQDFALLGVSCAALIALKLSLGVVAVAVVYLIATGRRDQRRIAMTSLVILIAAALLSSVFFWRAMFDPEVRNSFALLMEYIRKYAASPPIDGLFVRAAWKSVSLFFADNLSLSVTLCIVLGFASMIQSPNARVKRLAEVCSVLTVLLFISVCMERKFHPYHFVRMYLPLSVFTLYGLKVVVEFIRAVKNTHHHTLLMCGVIAILIVMSPLVRYISLLQPTYLGLTQPLAYENYYQRSGIPGLQRVDQQRIADSIRVWRKDNEKLLVVAVDATRLNLLVHEPCWSPFAGSQFTFSMQAPREWLERGRRECGEADWIVVSTTDNYPYVNLHSRTSLQSLEQDSSIGPVFHRDFQRVLQTQSLDLYHRVNRQ